MTNAHGLTASNMMQMLPRVLLEDEGMAALANSVAAVLEKRRGEVQNIAIYTRIDQLPGDLLDILARDFKIDWWDNRLDLQTKRQLLKDCWHTHRILGTKEAVVRTLRTLYGFFDIREWWEYEGEPGYFRIETESFPLICELKQFLGALDGVKRLSAHLEKIDVTAKVPETVGVGVAQKITMGRSYVMEPCDMEQLQTYLTDENGQILTDEVGDILTV